MASTPHSATPPPVVPSGYRSQAADTSPQADWVLFEQLRQMPAPDRYERFRSFNSAWRPAKLIRSGSRLWWLCAPTQTAVRTYLQRRYGADWLTRQNQDAIAQFPLLMLLDPIAFALKIATILAPLDLNYYVGGSVASSLHGESRATRDIDLAVVIAPDAIEALIQAFVEANFSISEVAVREAVESIEPGRSFNVIDTASAEKAAIFPLKGDPERISFAARFAQSQMARRQLLDFPDGQVYVCTAEDIILQKLKWRRTSGSTEQWSDILGVMKLQQAQLDFDYLRLWAPRLQVEGELAQAAQEAGL